MYLYSRNVRLGPGNPENNWVGAQDDREGQPDLRGPGQPVDHGLLTRLGPDGVDGDLRGPGHPRRDVRQAHQRPGLHVPGRGGWRPHVRGPVDDGLLQIIHADQKAAEIDAKYAVAIRATLAPGSAVKGIELGVEIALLASKITGSPTSFGTT